MNWLYIIGGFVLMVLAAASVTTAAEAANGNQPQDAFWTKFRALYPQNVIGVAGLFLLAGLVILGLIAVIYGLGARWA